MAPLATLLSDGRAGLSLQAYFVARYGVKDYWLVDPEEQTVEVLTLGEMGFKIVGVYGKAEALKAPLLSNLEINLSEIF